VAWAAGEPLEITTIRCGSTFRRRRCSSEVWPSGVCHHRCLTPLSGQDPKVLPGVPGAMRWRGWWRAWAKGVGPPWASVDHVIPLYTRRQWPRMLVLPVGKKPISLQADSLAPQGRGCDADGTSRFSPRTASPSITTWGPTSLLGNNTLVAEIRLAKNQQSGHRWRKVFACWGLRCGPTGNRRGGFKHRQGGKQAPRVGRVRSRRPSAWR